MMTATHESLHLSVLSMLFRLSMAKLFLHFQTFRTTSFIQVSHAPSIQVERKNAKLSLSFSILSTLQTAVRVSEITPPFSDHFTNSRFFQVYG